MSVSRELTSATGRDATRSARQYEDQAFLRAAGAPLVSGNGVRILIDAAENFPAWLDSIRAAKRSILFECYIIDHDHVGREFITALAERARAGVYVRVIYDWLGTNSPLWISETLAPAGAEVRCFNPPSLASPFGWISRDHRKMIAVDGQVGYVSGLCVSGKWTGDQARGTEPWRDTGVEIRGPAVADLEDAFARVWDAIGSPLPEEAFTPLDSIESAGEVDVRVVASEPNSAGVLRLDQFIAAVASERLWLTDAYFVGTAPYIQALRSAARDGIDVRLLVPGSSDVPIVGAISRAGYRPLLEAGVRVFEWNGTMLHAKSAVADRRWARIGSTNLNIASWFSNYELDVFVEDEAFAAKMADLYESDLGRATEIVLHPRKRLSAGWRRSRRKHPKRARSGSAGRAAAGALSIGSAVGAVLTNRRPLGPAEATLLVYVGLILIGVAVVGVFWPRLLAIPLAVIATVLAATTLARAFRLRRARSGEAREGREDRGALGP
ncbi:MAG: phospholipase D-like domain-containing protein [Betaproteobacteria bacterium]|jgi:cardiolipin synthase|nr:phospholipase D-like domain-containing protein [Betaproteobacteria bacterium]